jgi:TIR domain-containing protein
MTDIFISYSQADKDIAGGLAQSLDKKGYAVWWDEHLRAGQVFDDKIRSELMMAKAVVVIWTPASVKSDYVRMETGIGYAWNKLIPVRGPGLTIQDIPVAFQKLQTAEISDVERIVDALEEMEIWPQQRGAPRKLSMEEIIQALGRKDASLPAAVQAWLQRCRQEGLRVLVRRSIIIKGAVPDFGDVNLCTLYQDGTFNTNYIADSAARISAPAIADEYLRGVAALIDGATVRNDGKPWTWRVDRFGALPEISYALPKSEEWIALMKKTQESFIKAAAEKTSD